MPYFISMLTKKFYFSRAKSTTDDPFENKLQYPNLSYQKDTNFLKQQAIENNFEHQQDSSRIIQQEINDLSENQEYRNKTRDYCPDELIQQAVDYLRNEEGGLLMSLEEKIENLDRQQRKIEVNKQNVTVTNAVQAPENQKIVNCNAEEDQNQIIAANQYDRQDSALDVSDVNEDNVDDNQNRININYQLDTVDNITNMNESEDGHEDMLGMMKYQAHMSTNDQQDTLDSITRKKQPVVNDVKSNRNEIKSNNFQNSDDLSNFQKEMNQDDEQNSLDSSEDENSTLEEQGDQKDNGGSGLYLMIFVFLFILLTVGALLYSFGDSKGSYSNVLNMYFSDVLSEFRKSAEKYLNS